MTCVWTTDEASGWWQCDSTCTMPEHRQVGGSHYTQLAIQPWDAMQAWMSREAFAGFLLGNVVKYAARYRAKGGAEDLRKARHYLDRLIQLEETAR